MPDGMELGDPLGIAEGIKEGFDDGTLVGILVGFDEGMFVPVGSKLGAFECDGVLLG